MGDAARFTEVRIGAREGQSVVIRRYRGAETLHIGVDWQEQDVVAELDLADAQEFARELLRLAGEEAQHG